MSTQAFYNGILYTIEYQPQLSDSYYTQHKVYYIKTERTYLSKDGKSTVLWKIGTKYYAEIDTYYDENFWQGEDNAFERSEYIIEVNELKDEEVEDILKTYESYE